jgi:hypothetical protein
MPRRPYILIALAACAIAVGCGSGSHRTASHHRAKHIVLTKASLGFGAFHRFVWLPARAGRLADPLSPAVSHAAAAARFTSNELRVAAQQVQRSKRLRVLFAPLELTADKVSALDSDFFRNPSRAQIAAINEILTRVAAAAKDNGAQIVDASAAEIAAAGGPRA